jgi:bifunctional UDP-N-acetylglucosamine pyrophosphorylase/glucosamine-1-phosphate N-acetyltransferase
MRPLSNGTPKPLLEVAGKTLLEHKFDRLPEEITEIILVIGYLGEKIKKHCGDNYNNLPIRYVEQKENSGTGGAVWVAQDLLDDRFLVINGDDLHLQEDIETCLKYPWSILVQSAETIANGETFIGGNVITDTSGNLKNIQEGKHKSAGAYAAAGMYVLGKEFFDYELVPKAPGNEEFGLPQTLVTMAQDIPIAIVKTENWVTATQPSDLEKVEIWLEKDS